MCSYLAFDHAVNPRTWLQKPGFAQWIAAILLMIALAGCGEHTAPANHSETSAQRYELRGAVISVDAAAKKAVIKHEKIADLMDAMQMSFSVPEAADLDRLQPGKLIHATLVVENGMMWLEGVSVVGDAPAPDADADTNHHH